MKTIKDIARISGYSIGTVSRVINNHPDVSDETRKKIKEIIEKEHYQPNTNAKNMKIKTSDIISILVKGQANVFFAELLEVLQRRLEDASQEISVHYMDENADEVQEAFLLIKEKKSKGLIFLGGDLKNYAEVLSSYRIPSVLLTNSPYSQDPLISSFTTDNEAAAYSAVHHLILKGHKHIAIVGGNQNTPVGKARLQGGIRALNEIGVEFKQSYYEPSRFSLDGGYTATSMLLQRHNDITALFALGDTIALGALRCLVDHNYEVPKQISLIGFDGIELGQYAIPRLTTIHQDIETMANKAVDDLLVRLNYQRDGIHEIIPFQVIKGATVSSI